MSTHGWCLFAHIPHPPPYLHRWVGRKRTAAVKGGVGCGWRKCAGCMMVNRFLSSSSHLCCFFGWTGGNVARYHEHPYPRSPPHNQLHDPVTSCRHVDMSHRSVARAVMTFYVAARRGMPDSRWAILVLACRCASLSCSSPLEVPTRDSTHSCVPATLSRRSLACVHELAMLPPKSRFSLLALCSSLLCFQ